MFVKALNHSNLFWRLHAQRLLVERGKLDVVPKLLKIVDRVHKEKPHLAIHALWTLHGLNGFENISDRHREMIFGLMSHSNPSIQRTALLIAPEDEKTARRILDYSLLDSPDLPIRLQAILKSCRLPGSPELIEALLSTGLKPENQNDTVFAAAIYLALKHHSEILRAEQYEAKAGELRGVQAGWHLPAFDPKRWQTIKTGLPFEAQEIAELKDFNGLIWYRTDIYLTEALADEKITLHLGPVDNSDVTWINGVQVGSTIERWDMPRVYTLPAGLLKKGKNTIAIQVDDPRDVGGLTGKDIFFQAGHKKIPIPVEWRYAIEKRYASYYDPSKDLLDLLEKRNQQGKTLEAGDKVAVSILLKTKPGKMQFDRDTIRAPAGKRIEILFVNDDNMPHNLVVGKPGTLSEIGLASEKITGQTTFVPAIEAVLFALPLVLQGERKTLSFIAPTVPGDYVLVCTYPGHWRVMHGVLSVR